MELILFLERSFKNQHKFKILELNKEYVKNYNLSKNLFHLERLFK